MATDGHYAYRGDHIVRYINVVLLRSPEMNIILYVNYTKYGSYKYINILIFLITGKSKHIT